MKSKTLLIVDDEPHVRYMLELKLRSAGFNILTAKNGKQAFEIAAQRFPDAIITDLQMPGCSGLDLCEQLKANVGTANIPVLMLTARGHRIAAEDLAKTNIRQMLAKPFSPREVVKLVHALVGGAPAPGHRLGGDRSVIIVSRSTSTPSATAQLSDRCRTLGLPVWQFDENRKVVERPTGWGPSDQWLRAPLLIKLLARTLSQWSPTASPRVTELFPGGWIMPLVNEEPDGTRTFSVAMALSRDVFGSEQFLAICDSARLDAMITKTALSPLARYKRSDLDRLASVLQWMHVDLSQLEDNRNAIVSFSGQTLDMYEHIQLLYRLGKAINGLEHPVEFVNLALSQLYETLDFEWIAAAFTSRSLPDPALLNSLLIYGQPPCEQRKLMTLARDLASGAPPEPGSLLLEPGDHPLSTLVGDEVVVERLISANQVIGVLVAGNKQGSDPDVSSIDIQLIDAAGEYLGSFLHSAAAFNEQRTMFMGTMRAITSTIEAKDRYTRGHSDRVAYLAVQLGRAHGLSEPELVRVRLAGMLHDAGKIGVPESVLCKPGNLTEEEFEAIKRHPVIGYNILKDIEPLSDILPGVLYHHERWDGSGYPQGLAGEQIPLLGRLLAVVDMFDAMSSDRAYRSKLARQLVREEIRARGGTQLDPVLAETFLTLDLTEYDRMIERHRAQEPDIGVLRSGMSEDHGARRYSGTCSHVNAPIRTDPSGRKNPGGGSSAMPGS